MGISSARIPLVVRWSINVPRTGTSDTSLFNSISFGHLPSTFHAELVSDHAATGLFVLLIFPNDFKSSPGLKLEDTLLFKQIINSFKLICDNMR